MKNIICHHCGAGQPADRKTCISCGEELHFSEAEGADMIDKMLYFRSTPFTIGVSIASYIAAPIILVLFVVMCARETHDAGVLLMALLFAVLAVIYSRFPIFSYRYMFRGRYNRRRPEDFDDPYPSSIRSVYIMALIMLVLAVIAVVMFYCYLDEFAIRPPISPDQLTPDMFEREIHTSSGVYRIG